jgi:hypothetical protein
MGMFKMFERDEEKQTLQQQTASPETDRCRAYWTMSQRAIVRKICAPYAEGQRIPRDRYEPLLREVSVDPTLTRERGEITLKSAAGVVRSEGFSVYRKVEANKTGKEDVLAHIARAPLAVVFLEKGKPKAWFPITILDVPGFYKAAADQAVASSDSK